MQSLNVFSRNSTRNHVVGELVLVIIEEIEVDVVDVHVVI